MLHIERHFKHLREAFDDERFDRGDSVRAWPIGLAIARELARRSGVKIVGAVDIDNQKVGKDVGSLIGLKEPLGVMVSLSLKEVLSGHDAPVVTLSTVSSLNACFPQIEEILRYKKCIVSTCDELAPPWETHPDLSRKIDCLAKENGAAVLGTGVNPGFAMDFLPVVALGVCSEVKRIKVFRIQDASFRRLPFQKKIGVELSVVGFEEKKAT